MKTQPYRGNHLPVLMKLASMTNGPILELGSGMYSTTYLHWLCFANKRRLVTYEDNLNWFDFTKQFASDYHLVRFVDDWDKIDIEEPWSIAFVDHDPITDRKRVEELKRLTHSEYVVAHDSENGSNRKYGYFDAYKMYKYRFKFNDAGFPYTSIFSNKHDVTNFKVIL